MIFMRKIFSALLAAAMMFCFTLSFAALPENSLPESGKWGSNMPEADYHILKTNTAPAIDGVFDGESVWGQPIFDISGNDSYWFTRERAALNPLYVSWAITTSNLWTKTDGSVEMIRNARFTGYARWDDSRLYMAFVVQGITYQDDEGYYFSDNLDENGLPTWYGNGIQVAFGPENKKLNLDAAAYKEVRVDAEGNEYLANVEGYVGNEYLLAITNTFSEPNKCQGMITRGRYDDLAADGGRTPKLPASMEGDFEFCAQNDASKAETGYQIYEMALPFGEFGFHGTVDQGKSEGIPFSVAFNVQGSDQFTEASFNGFQVGAGIFQQDKTKIFDSTCLILEDSAWTCPGHTGGEELANCMAQAKCIKCDTRYGAYGDHSYDAETGLCIYCGSCQVHSFPTEEDLAANPELDPKVCMICGYREVSGSEVLVGDLNGDGVVNSADAALMNRYAAKWDITGAVNANKENYMDFFATFADTNGDGDINSADAALMNRFAAKWDLKNCMINTIVVVEVNS